MVPRPRRCANCRDVMPSRANTGVRGHDIAWLVHCKICEALVSSQMQTLMDQPNDAPIRILRCRHCGATRACRPRWRTRCMVCLDERTRLDPCPWKKIEEDLDNGPGMRDLFAKNLDVKPEDLTQGLFLQSLNAWRVAQSEEDAAQPGWTVLALDIHGLPFFLSESPSSHGTWASHDACGTVQLLRAGRNECRHCPPDPASRTHRAKADQPQLLYLVRYLDLLKFGHGDTNRVRAHLRAQCQPVQVLQAPHEAVVAAELAIKRELRDQVIDPEEWWLPPTFGAGSEVVPDDTEIDLSSFLPPGQWRDVTGKFV